MSGVAGSSGDVERVGVGAGFPTVPVPGSHALTVGGSLIIRVPHHADYAVISNRALSDKRLSWKARGVLAYLLTKPDGWEVMVAELIGASPDGRRVIDSALDELETCGYLVRPDQAKDETGRFSAVSIEVWEEPVGGYPSRENANGSHQGVRAKVQVGTDGGFPSTDNARLVSTEVVSTETIADAPIRGNQRPPDLLWEAVVREVGIDLDRVTSSARGGINAAVGQLRRVGANADDIGPAAKAYARKFPGAALTATALAKHWPTLGGSSRPQPVDCVRCGRPLGASRQDSQAGPVCPGGCT